MEIIETEGEVDRDKIDVSRWTQYGKDRLYINHDGSSSHDDCYVDLDGGEGHSTWASASFDVDADIVVIEWRIGWDGNWTENKVVIDVDPEADKNLSSEVPPEVPQTAHNQGLAQQINAQNLAGDN